MKLKEKIKIDQDYRAPNQTKVGHIHLKVTDLQESIVFYRDLLGFELTTMYGDQAAFLSAGGYHHHIGLNTWHSENAGPAPIKSAGMYHVAFLYPERKDLAQIYTRLQDSGYQILGASDHGVSEAIYLQDPDGNGVELYWDRPQGQWPYKANGEINMITKPLDLKSLLESINQ